MSNEAQSAVLSPAMDALGLTPTQRHILMLLANLADEDGECFPSIRYLVTKSGFSERGVQKTLASLEAAPLSLIVRASQSRRGDGRQGANLFTLTFVSPALTPAPRAPHPRTTCTPPPHHVHPTPAPRAPPTTLDTSLDTPLDTTGAREIAFDRLSRAWAMACPGRLAPPLARRAFEQAAQRHDPGLIAAAGERYLGLDPGVKRTGPKLLHLWLDEDRWQPWIVDATTPATRRFCGPPEIRAAFVADKGEDFVASWLDWAGWDADRRAILPANSLGVDRLKSLGAARLAAIGVDRIETAKARAAELRDVVGT